MATFQPLAACIGGGFIGIACGAYMLFAGRIAGNSGALKAALLGPREPTKLAFLGGLAVAGLLMKWALPDCFEALPVPSLSLAAAGLAVGFGTALGNGCTSGHGLCGLSRLSLRSLVAVPTFMVAAIATATMRSGGVIGAPLPMAGTPQPTLELAGRLAAGLLAALPPCALLPTSGAKEAYAGLWSGACFGVGLSIGGMVRPSVVTNALSLAQFDGTLWALFITALLVTFVAYRVAARAGVQAASTFTSASGKVDIPLVVGALAFGVGWGLSGLCPGPHLVTLAAHPTSAGLLLMLASVSTGMALAQPLARLARLLPPDATTGALAELHEVKHAVAQLAATGRATIVDLRPLSTEEAIDGRFESIIGALSAPFDRETRTMPTKALPKEKHDPLVVYCRSGSRAKQAAAFLKTQGCAPSSYGQPARPPAPHAPTPASAA